MKEIFNDAITWHILFLRLYGIEHMVKDHSAREETCCHHSMTPWAIHSNYPDRIAHTTMLYQMWNTGWNEKRLLWGMDPLTNHTMSRRSTTE